MAYNFTLSRQVGNWLVEVDPAAHYGYFENQVTGTSGGLWFDKQTAGPLELVDYGGVYELNCRVIAALEDLGINVAYALDDELETIEPYTYLVRVQYDDLPVATYKLQAINGDEARGAALDSAIGAGLKWSRVQFESTERVS